MNCILCNTPLSVRKDYAYFDCGICGALVMDRNLWPDASKEYARYREHINDINDLRYKQFTAPVTEYVLKHFKPDHEGLDFGSGTGPVISSELQRKAYTVVQYDPFFAPYPSVLKKCYHYIVCSEVLEHLHDPRKELLLLKNILYPAGALVCMTFLYHKDIPFQNWHYRNDPTHVIIYREKSMQFIREEFGFQSCLIKGRLIVFNL